MSVFTPVSQSELETFLSAYNLGRLVSYEGISAGIENTNFFVTTEHGRYVLTLFEKHTADEMDFFLNLMAHLAERGIPSPHPLADLEGHYLKTLNGKPAALVQRLEGASELAPAPVHCAAVGSVLARMHLAAGDYPYQRENDRGPRWWRTASEQVLPRLSPEDARILDDELRFQGLYRFTDLPRGVIHADLFRDNVMFLDGELSGVIDFYYACNDALLYDLAVTANDWCSNADGSLDPERLQALMNAYHAERRLSPIERGAWPVMLRAAALRFWLSRLMDLHFPRPGEITHTKDPEVFKQILLDRIRNEAWLQRAWVA
ncbi:MAG: homoserine kinase [Gammaproteobacteria bacterium]|jgi:homoserine kinase type II